MKKRYIVYGSSQDLCIDFERETVFLFRHDSWVTKTLKLVNIAIPFKDITAIEYYDEAGTSGGIIDFLVNDTRILANDPQFENNAGEFSLNAKMYAFLKEAVSEMSRRIPGVQIFNGKVNAPKAKIQDNFATAETLSGLLNTCNQDDCAVLKGEALSVGAVLLIGIVGLGLLAAAVFALL